MLNAKYFAHAVTIVTAVFYLACWGLSTLTPDLVTSIAGSWIHTINLEAIKSTTQISFLSGVMGLITISGLAWITTYATIWLYNKLKK